MQDFCRGVVMQFVRSDGGKEAATWRHHRLTLHPSTPLYAHFFCMRSHKHPPPLHTCFFFAASSASSSVISTSAAASAGACVYMFVWVCLHQRAGIGRLDVFECAK